MSNDPNRTSPRYRVIKNGMGEWILQELKAGPLTREGRFYYYDDIEVCPNREYATQKLAKLKDADARSKEIARARAQIVEEIT